MYFTRGLSSAVLFLLLVGHGIADVTNFTRHLTEYDQYADNFIKTKYAIKHRLNSVILEASEINPLYPIYKTNLLNSVYIALREKIVQINDIKDNLMLFIKNHKIDGSFAQSLAYFRTVEIDNFAECAQAVEKDYMYMEQANGQNAAMVKPDQDFALALAMACLITTTPQLATANVRLKMFVGDMWKLLRLLMRMFYILDRLPESFSNTVGRSMLDCCAKSGITAPLTLYDHFQILNKLEKTVQYESRTFIEAYMRTFQKDDIVTQWIFQNEGVLYDRCRRNYFSILYSLNAIKLEGATKMEFLAPNSLELFSNEMLERHQRHFSDDTFEELLKILDTLNRNANAIKSKTAQKILLDGFRRHLLQLMVLYTQKIKPTKEISVNQFVHIALYRYGRTDLIEIFNCMRGLVDPMGVMLPKLHMNMQSLSMDQIKQASLDDLLLNAINFKANQDISRLRFEVYEGIVRRIVALPLEMIENSIAQIRSFFIIHHELWPQLKIKDLISYLYGVKMFTRTEKSLMKRVFSTSGDGKRNAICSSSAGNRNPEPVHVPRFVDVKEWDKLEKKDNKNFEREIFQDTVVAAINLYKLLLKHAIIAPNFFSDDMLKDLNLYETKLIWDLNLVATTLIDDAELQALISTFNLLHRVSYAKISTVFSVKYFVVFASELRSSDYDLERIISKIEDILNVEPYDAKMCTALFKVLLTHCNFSRMNKSPVNSFYALYLYLTIKQRFGFNEEVKDLDQLWNSYYDTPQIQTSMEFFLQRERATFDMIVNRAIRNVKRNGEAVLAIYTVILLLQHGHGHQEKSSYDVCNDRRLIESMLACRFSLQLNKPSLLSSEYMTTLEMGFFEKFATPIVEVISDQRSKFFPSLSPFIESITALALSNTPATSSYLNYNNNAFIVNMVGMTLSKSNLTQKGQVARLSIDENWMDVLHQMAHVTLHQYATIYANRANSPASIQTLANVRAFLNAYPGGQCSQH